MIDNRHERILHLPQTQAAPLLDQLASPEDLLWPAEHWPAMRFDGPLRVGARGGHGPIRYFVEEYQPGRRLTFRFTAPSGFVGQHGLTLEPLTEGTCRLSHWLRMDVSVVGWLQWHLVFRPLHDALVEDALDRGAHTAGARWSVYVRLLRTALKLVRPRPGRFHARRMP